MVAAIMANARGQGHNRKPRRAATGRDGAKAVECIEVFAARCRADAAYSGTSGRFISASTAWRGAIPS